MNTWPIFKKNIIKSSHEHVYQGQKKQLWYHSFQYWKLQLRSEAEEEISPVTNWFFFQYWEFKLRSEEEISTVTNWFEIQNLKNNMIKSTHEHVYQGQKNNNDVRFPDFEKMTP